MFGYVSLKPLLFLSSLQSVRSWWGFAVWWRNQSPNPWLRSWSDYVSLSTSPWSSFLRTSYSMIRWKSGRSVTAWSLFTQKVCLVLCVRLPVWGGLGSGFFTEIPTVKWVKQLINQHQKDSSPTYKDCHYLCCLQPLYEFLLWNTKGYKHSSKYCGQCSFLV